MTSSPLSGLSKSCRAMLRGTPRESLLSHVESCEFCRDWLQKRERLTSVLSQAVKPPAELRSVAMLDNIRGRIVESCESSILGRALDQSMPVSPELVVDEWPMQESELADQIREVSVVAPRWSEVRDSVLGDAMVGQTSVATRVVAGAGVVAAIVLCALLLTQREDTTSSPQITFTDVTSLSGVGYSPMNVLRNGGADE